MKPTAFFLRLLVVGVGMLSTLGCLNAADAPVALPKVDVTASYQGKMEHWRYARVGSFEILSQLNDATLTQLAQTLELIPVITKTIWPAPVSVEQKPTAILLCTGDNPFLGFIPQEVNQAVKAIWVDRLFLKDDHEEIIVLDCDRTGNQGRIMDIVRDYARRWLLALKQPPPDWFVTGMAEVIAHADYTLSPGRVKIHYADLDRPVVHTSQAGFEPTLYETEKPSQAVRAIIRGALDGRSAYEAMADDSADLSYQVSHERFNNYFLRNHYQPHFEDVLRNNPAVDPDDYRMNCWAFVHLCAFAQKRGYGKPLEAYLRAAAKKSDVDINELFRKTFKQSPESMGLTVTEYATTTSSHGATKEVEFPDPTPVVFSDATAEQIGRLKGDALRLGGHPNEAAVEAEKARFFQSLESSKKP